MKLRILSDLHIEFHPFDIPPMDDDDETVLILAGDIGVIYRAAELESFLREAAARFRAVIYVLGNHEFYRGIWPDAMQALRGWNLPGNIHMLERECVQIDDVVFVGATLWTDFDGEDRSVMQAADQSLNDFHYIRVNAGTDAEADRLKPEHVLDDHNRSRAWLTTTLGALRAQGKRTVLVTHHGISRLSIHESYRDNPLNGAFVSDCVGVLKRTGPELVIHGHVHNSFDYRLATEFGSTRIVVNPRGYTQCDATQENALFDPLLTVDLGA